MDEITNANALLAIDRWLPEKLRAVDNQWRALQARVFVVLLLISFVPFIPITLAMIYVSLLGFVNLWLFSLLILAAVIGQMACFFYFQKTANLSIASFIYSGFAFFMVGTVICFTGGWESPVCVYLLILPVIIGLVVGPVAASFFAILILLFYSALLFLFEIDYLFVQLIPDNSIVVIRAILWVLAGLTIVGCLLLYDFSAKNLSESVATDQAQLERDANHDALTGAYNEQALFERISEMQRARKLSRQEYALIYIDIRNYFQVAGQFGFEVGDIFLRRIAEALQAVMQREGMLVRYSENGFAVFVERVKGSGRLINLIAKLQNLNEYEIILGKKLSQRVLLRVGTLVTASKSMPPEEMVDKARANALRSGGKLYTRV